MKNKRLIIIVLSLFLIGLILLLGFLYFDFRRLSDQGRPIKERESLQEDNKYIPIQEGSPIEKGILPEDKGFSYELEGTFTEEIRLDDGFMRGIFVLNDDPLGRNIEIVLGTPDGMVYTGYYEGSFDSASTWQFRETSTIASALSPGDPVKITVVLSRATTTDGYFKDVVDALDTIAKEFSMDEFNYRIPENFVLAGTRIGLIQ